MKLTRVKRVLTRRLAYLAAKVEKGAGPFAAEEHDALETALRCLNMLDREDVEARTARVFDRVLPAQQRDRARARQGDALATKVGELVAEIQRAARAA